MIWTEKGYFPQVRYQSFFHISVSSLRHYENIGLLQPEDISPETGYRYYGTAQFEVLNTIRYLRALNMPLAENRRFAGYGSTYQKAGSVTGRGSCISWNMYFMKVPFQIVLVQYLPLFYISVI